MILQKLQVSGRVQFDLEFKANMVLVGGKSATGKTYLFKCLQKYKTARPITPICFVDIDILSNDGCTIEKFLEGNKNKLIFIDNADVLIANRKLRQWISEDIARQYVIFTHSTQGYYPYGNCLANLIIKNNTGFFKYLEDEDLVVR